MKFLELYNKMIQIFQSESGIRAKLCQFFKIENKDKTVKEIIKENKDFNNSVEVIKNFVKDFYEYGGMQKESFDEFQRFVSGSIRPINRVIFAAGDKIDTTLDVSYNEITVVEDINKYLIYNKDS
ncbi:hypothetical protein [Clostridium sp.]|uniref:hypothetical protein n=1 Tax=Clostridium sp. TaxID=1506 RepID=UPI002FC6BFCA